MVKLVYILAGSHSGSTLLAMLLGSHPEICTVGELKLSALGDVEQYRCSCGEKITRCPFWNKVGQVMGQKGIAFDIGTAGTDFRGCQSRYARRLVSPMHHGSVLEKLRDTALKLSPAWNNYYSTVQRRNEILIETLLEITGTRMIVDSSKNGVRLKYLLRNPRLNIKVIRLIRDGRGVALTYLDPAEFADASDPTLREGGTGGQWSRGRLSMRQAAWEWKRSNEEAEHILGNLDRSKWMEVHYEMLCQKPDDILAAIFNFLNVNPRVTVKDFRRVEYHVLGNGMRFDNSSDIILDERWRTRLSQADLQVFETTAGEMNRRYGYQ